MNRLRGSKVRWVVAGTVFLLGTVLLQQAIAQGKNTTINLNTPVSFPVDI